jgi:hypothetical protein
VGARELPPLRRAGRRRRPCLRAHGSGGAGPLFPRLDRGHRLSVGREVPGRECVAPELFGRNRRRQPDHVDRDRRPGTDLPRAGRHPRLVRHARCHHRRDPALGPAAASAASAADRPHGHGLGLLGASLVDRDECGAGRRLPQRPPDRDGGQQGLVSRPAQVARHLRISCVRGRNLDLLADRDGAGRWQPDARHPAAGGLRYLPRTFRFRLMRVYRVIRR